VSKAFLEAEREAGENKRICTELHKARILGDQSRRKSECLCNKAVDLLLDGAIADKGR
jgi:hypothetical protein